MSCVRQQPIWFTGHAAEELGLTWAITTYGTDAAARSGVWRYARSVTTTTDERAALAQSSEKQGWKRRAIDDRVDVYSRGAIRIRVIWQGEAKLSGASIFVDEWYDNYTRDLGTVAAWLKR